LPGIFQQENNHSPGAQGNLVLIMEVLLQKGRNLFGLDNRSRVFECRRWVLVSTQNLMGEKGQIPRYSSFQAVVQEEFLLLRQETQPCLPSADQSREVIAGLRSRGAEDHLDRGKLVHQQFVRTVLQDRSHLKGRRS
jgi:hypothetical protein